MGEGREGLSRFVEVLAKTIAGPERLELAMGGQGRPRCMTASGVGREKFSRSCHHGENAENRGRFEQSRAP